MRYIGLLALSLTQIGKSGDDGNGNTPKQEEQYQGGKNKQLPCMPCVLRGSQLIPKDIPGVWGLPDHHCMSVVAVESLNDMIYI